MKSVVKYIICLCIAGFAGAFVHLNAQEEIRKEIVVVKPYQPSLSDAFKINVQPHISDSIPIRPSFDYSIRPKKFETSFQVRPISAARMVGTPLTKLYKSYLKLGIGNYLAPLAELNLNSLRDKNWQWGIAVNHYSINGKLKLDNDQKVHPGYFENSASLYGKRILKKTYLSGKIGGAYDGANFYGSHPSLPTDTTALQKEEIRQNWMKLDGRFRMGTMHKDSLHLNWIGNLDYLYTRDHYKNFEHAAIFSAEGNERFRSGMTYGLNLDGAYYYTSESIDSSNNVVASLNPWLGKTTREFTYRVGFELALDVHGQKVSPHFYPEAMLQINLVEGILIPYFGVDGRLQVNNFRTVAEENRYITPGLKVENSTHKIRGYAGLKGSFSRNISYELKASYSLVDKMPLYINDTSTIFGNTFIVVYDNLEWMQLRGEVQYRQSERLRTLLSVTYNHYRMEALEKPWHMPGLLISADGEYNLHNKILVDMGVYYTGKRYAPATPLDTEMITLKGFVDLNLGVEYRYTKILSGFVRVNNILGSRIYTWNQYPGMGFNLMFGFTYAL
jgi:hypothetical protein